MKKYLLWLIEVIVCLFIAANMLGLATQGLGYARGGNGVLFFVGMMCLAHLCIWSELNSRKKKDA